jgi:TolB protein
MLRMQLCRWMLMAGLAVAAMGAGAQDAITITSQGAGSQKTSIAVPPFAASDPTLTGAAREMAEVIAYDLAFTDLFKLLEPIQYPQNFNGFSSDVSTLDLPAWSGKAQNLVWGVVSVQGDTLVAQLRLFDLQSNDQVFGQELRVPRNYARLAAHRFSEEIVRYIDGEAGIGSTEIVFSGGETGKKELYVADYDGSNARQITQHGSVSIKPKISPDGNKIAYVSYKDGYPFIYVFDRATGRSTQVSREVGTNISPAWSPDGRRLAMTLSKDGNTEIYVKNADGSNPVRLTRNRNGDTSPTWSPDGSRIAFVSDRGGAPQIYVMSSSGGEATRLTFQGGSSYDPAWSPDGKYIAYAVERSGDGFEIYMVGANGGQAVRLTNSAGSNESPTWSPDSRHIMFMTTRSGRPELWTVNPSTGTERPVPGIRVRAEGPTWGPRRK